VDSITVVVIIAVVVIVSLSYALWIQSVAIGQVTKAKSSLCFISPSARVIKTEARTITVQISIRNKCSKTQTIDLILVDEKPYTNVPTPLQLTPGEKKTLIITLPRVPGKTYKITFHTVTDTNYVAYFTSP